MLYVPLNTQDKKAGASREIICSGIVSSSNHTIAQK
jgi:hypothetical protein